MTDDLDLITDLPDPGTDYPLGNPIESPKAKGKIMILPKPNEVFIDIDSSDASDVYFTNSVNSNFLNAFGYKEIKRIRSSKGHYHITGIVNRSLTPVERLAIEVGLGSDPKRALLNMVRLETEDYPECVSCFFELPEERED